MIGVYVITCIPTGRFYVGSSENIAKRKHRHLRDLRRGKHHNDFLQRVFNKYGEPAFAWKIKLTESKVEAVSLEQHYLFKHMFDPLCMNIGVHATGGDNLTKHPDRENIIARMTASVRASMLKLSVEEKKKLFGLKGIRNGMYGKNHTEQARALMTAAVRSRDYSHLKGIPKSAETKQKLAEAAKRRVASEDYRNPFAGKTHSAETLQRCSEVNLGRKPPNRRKIRVGKKTYDSLKDCARDLDVVVGTVWHRLGSVNFPEYTYVT